MSKHVTTADFIQRARKVHGNQYDYTKALYTTAKTKVIIICPKHGEFEQTPANHCTGRGCHECGGNKPLTLNRFIERARMIHKVSYDYSRVKFKNVEDNVEIVCPYHSSFSQRLMSHLKGFGCDRCGRFNTAKKLSHSRERFLEDAKLAHGNRYDYSQVQYINALTKITIICSAHGAFKQNPANHIRDVGCPKCGDESTALKRTRTTQDFVLEAKDVHGDRYDYSKVEYRSSHKTVQICCPAHGSFWQSPTNHVRGNKAGCPGCAASGFDQTKPALLYYIAITTDDGDILYKIGITNLSIKRRFLLGDRERIIRVIKLWRFPVGRNAAVRETEILRKFKTERYYGPKILVSAGNTELFIRDVLGLDREYIKQYSGTGKTFSMKRLLGLNNKTE